MGSNGKTLLCVELLNSVLKIGRRNGQDLCRKNEQYNIINSIYRRTALSAADTFQDLSRLRETADNTERYIQRDIT